MLALWFGSVHQLSMVSPYSSSFTSHGYIAHFIRHLFTRSMILLTTPLTLLFCAMNLHRPLGIGCHLSTNSPFLIVSSRNLRGWVLLIASHWGERCWKLSHLVMVPLSAEAPGCACPSGLSRGILPTTIYQSVSMGTDLSIRPITLQISGQSFHFGEWENVLGMYNCPLRLVVKAFAKQS